MKDRIITLRVTPTEYSKIKANADNEGVTVSRYLINKALANNGITNLTMQKIYSCLCIIKDHARKNELENAIIIEECDKLWQFLK